MIKFLPAMVVILCVVGSAFFYGHHEGYVDAIEECSATSLTAEVAAEKRAYANLKTQMQKQSAAISATKSEKDKIYALLSVAQARVNAIHATKDCSFGPDAVALLNSVRKVGPR